MAHVITPITRLLIANCGEIARRIIRTAHDMGISTVAIYADGDAQAPFVKEADSAVALNGRTTAETYLDVDKVLLLANVAVQMQSILAMAFCQRMRHLRKRLLMPA